MSSGELTTAQTRVTGVVPATSKAVSNALESPPNISDSETAAISGRSEAN